jgi:hypothetical protein
MTQVGFEPTISVLEPNMIRMHKSMWVRLAEHIVRVGDNKNACWGLVGKREGNTPLGRLRSRWEDNIMMDIREIGLSGMD